MERSLLKPGLVNPQALFASHSVPAICDNAIPSVQLPFNCDHHTPSHVEFQNIWHTCYKMVVGKNKKRKVILLLLLWRRIHAHDAKENLKWPWEKTICEEGIQEVVYDCSKSHQS